MNTGANSVCQIVNKDRISESSLKVHYAQTSTFTLSPSRPTLITSLLLYNIATMNDYDFKTRQYYDQKYIQGPKNPGTRQRYLPPQKRELTFGGMPPIERPVSSMSDTSFVSQAFGGVSINDLEHGAAFTGERHGGNGGYDAQRGLAGGYGYNVPKSSGGQGYGAGTYSPMMDNGGFNAPGGYGALGGARDSYGGYGAGVQGNYSYGNPAKVNTQVSLHLRAALAETDTTCSQTPSFNQQTSGGYFGPIGSAVPRYNDISLTIIINISMPSDNSQVFRIPVSDRHIFSRLRERLGARRRQSSGVRSRAAHPRWRR